MAGGTPAVGPKNGFVGRPSILAEGALPSRRDAAQHVHRELSRKPAWADRDDAGRPESAYASTMDALAGPGAVSPDDDFVVAQDTEFDEDELAPDDDHRPLDDSLKDEVPGIDEERRVDLRDEPLADDEG